MMKEVVFVSCRSYKIARSRTAAQPHPPSLSLHLLTNVESLRLPRHDPCIHRNKLAMKVPRKRQPARPLQPMRAHNGENANKQQKPQQRDISARHRHAAGVERKPGSEGEDLVITHRR